MYHTLEKRLIMFFYTELTISEKVEIKSIISLLFRDIFFHLLLFEKRGIKSIISLLFRDKIVLSPTPSQKREIKIFISLIFRSIMKFNSQLSVAVSSV